MVERGAWQHSFQFGGGKEIVVEPSQTLMTSDAGLLPLRQFDDAIGLTAGFAAALQDSRRASHTTYSFLEMTRSRIFGILADYEDQNDHTARGTNPL